MEPKKQICFVDDCFVIVVKSWYWIFLGGRYIIKNIFDDTEMTLPVRRYDEARVWKKSLTCAFLLGIKYGDRVGLETACVE